MMLDQVLYQDEATNLLTRVVTGKTSRAQLLVGPEGVGKRTAATEVARLLLCSNPNSSGCSCFSCVQVQDQSHSDLVVLSGAGSTIGIGPVRDMLDLVQSYPSQGPCRVVIIDAADRLTGPAANAVLKTLEEPPEYLRFLLIAEKEQGVLPTIRSRCTRVPFRDLPESFVLSRLSQHEKDPARALVLTRLGEGSVGRSLMLWRSGRLSLRDQVFSLFRLALDRDLSSMFLLVRDLTSHAPLVLRFLHLLLCDLIMIEYDVQRLHNTDRVQDLATMAGQRSRDRWDSLRSDLEDLEADAALVDTGFQIKALLAAL